jgi:tetratricopeptide (TPR) repeat protein
VIGPNEAPYPGLRPFGRGEGFLFFGRDECVDEMLTRLGATRFLAVLGSSGTGKSSLVKTGFLSALEMGRLSGAGPRWRIVDFRPGGNPFRNLAAGLLQDENDTAGGPPDPASVDALCAAMAQGGPRALIEWCREGNLVPDTNLLLLVDQFEELFRYQDYDSRQRAEAFVSLLLESRSPIEAKTPTQAEFPIYVTITMRSEYLGACSLIQGLAEAINEGTYLTPRMKRREVEEAIVGPARVCGFEIERRLVSRLLNDMAGFAPWDESDSKDQLSRLARRADQLPLMQHALNRMWWRARKRQREGEPLILTLPDYRGLERELDEHAEQVYDSLDTSVQPTAECVFRAVTSGTTVADAVRRQTKYGELVAICAPENRDAVTRVIEAFGPGGCQFLTSDMKPTGAGPPDEALIDIAHESLIRQWKRLSTWVEAEGRAANEWRQLRDRAERKDVLSGRALSDAIAFQNRKPTVAWAGRYGGGFDKIASLITYYKWRRRLFVTLVPLIPIAVAAYVFYQNSVFARQNFVLAITSAQKVADQVRNSADRGQLTVPGARDMLTVTKGIAENARDIDATIETTELLIKLQHSISDIYYMLGDYDLAYQNAQRAKDLAEKLRIPNRDSVKFPQLVYDTIRRPFRATNPDDPRVLKFAYDSVWRMGDALSKQGKGEQALAQYQDAWNLAGRLVAQAPDDGARKREFVFIGQKLGDIQQARREFDAAIATYRTALGVIESLRARAPNNSGWRRDEAHTRRRIGQALVLKTNFTDQDFRDALEQFTATIDLDKELEEDSPTDTVAKSNLASDHQWLAKLYVKHRNWVSASSEYRAAIEIQERLSSYDPDNAAWQFPLGTFRLELGGVLKKQGKLDDALEQYQKSYDLRKDLARKQPSNAERQIRLANAAMGVASVLKAQNKSLDEAIALHREAITILDMSRPRHDDDVFDSYVDIGDIRLSQRDHENALTEYTRAWSIAKDIVADNPTSVLWRKRLTASYVKIGDVLAAQGRGTESHAQFQEALKIATDLVAQNPQNGELLALAESVKARTKNASSIINAIIRGQTTGSPLPTDEKEESHPR